MSEIGRTNDSVAVLLDEAERILLAGHMPRELVAAVIAFARKGAAPNLGDAAQRFAPSHERIVEADRLWSVRDLARYLGVHERTIVRHVEAGSLSGTRVGRQHRFRQRDVDEYLARVIRLSDAG